MQILAKFKKILYMGFRATLNFWKFKVALSLRELPTESAIFLLCILTAWMATQARHEVEEGSKSGSKAIHVLCIIRLQHVG